MLGLLQVFSRRTVHRIYLLSDFETVELEFFNAFWKPVTIRVAINEFQEPQPSLYETTRFEITSLGKIWIHETKNEFKNIQDYEDTLEHILFGRPITNLNVKKVLQDAKANRR